MNTPQIIDFIKKVKPKVRKNGALKREAIVINHMPVKYVHF